MSLKREFEGAVMDHYSAITELLERELIDVATATCPASTRFLLFEYDSPHFGEDFTASVWPMSGDGEAAAQGRWLLKDEAVAVPPEIFDDPVYEDVDPWVTASELLERWLVARWAQVRETCHAYPAFIGHHDSYFKTDLLTGMNRPAFPGGSNL